MQHDDRVYVAHMLDMARKALEITGTITRTDFDRDEVRRLALVHLVQNIGEAAGNVSEAFRSAHTEIPWPEVVGTRHRIVHDYMGINEDMIWDIVTSDLPDLIPKLAAIVDG